MIPTPPEDIARVLAAVDACPHRGPVVDKPDPRCGCRGGFLCRRDTRVVTSEDCVRCQFAALGLD